MHVANLGLLILMGLLIKAGLCWIQSYIQPYQTSIILLINVLITFKQQQIFKETCGTKSYYWGGGITLIMFTALLLSFQSIYFLVIINHLVGQVI